MRFEEATTDFEEQIVSCSSEAGTDTPRTECSSPNTPSRPPSGVEEEVAEHVQNSQAAAVLPERRRRAPSLHPLSIDEEEEQQQQEEEEEDDDEEDVSSTMAHTGTWSEVGGYQSSVDVEMAQSDLMSPSTVLSTSTTSGAAAVSGEGSSQAVGRQRRTVEVLENPERHMCVHLGSSAGSQRKRCWGEARGRSGRGWCQECKEWRRRSRDEVAQQARRRRTDQEEEEAAAQAKAKEQAEAMVPRCDWTPKEDECLKEVVRFMRMSNTPGAVDPTAFFTNKTMEDIIERVHSFWEEGAIPTLYRQKKPPLERSPGSFSDSSCSSTPTGSTAASTTSSSSHGEPHLQRRRIEVHRKNPKITDQTPHSVFVMHHARNIKR